MKMVLKSLQACALALSSPLLRAWCCDRFYFTHICFAWCHNMESRSATLFCVWVWARPPGSSSLTPAVFSVAVEVCRAAVFWCHFKMETTALLQTASHIALESLSLSSLFSFCSFALLFRDLGKLFSLLPVKLDVKREARLICEALKAFQTEACKAWSIQATKHPFKFKSEFNLLLYFLPSV